MTDAPTYGPPPSCDFGPLEQEQHPPPYEYPHQHLLQTQTESLSAGQTLGLGPVGNQRMGMLDVGDVRNRHSNV